METGDFEPLERVFCSECRTPFVVRATLANFTLIDVAGRGGMGVVYRAFDSTTNQRVAVKVLRKEHSEDPNLIAQLEAEAQMTAAISDPHVVGIYGFGHDHSRFYIAMELVDRGSLDDRINERGRLSEFEALEIGLQAANGLRAAYQRGVIHRDVKPGNLLFADEHRSKLVDFGLARSQQQAQAAIGELWGTPDYVAPEKLEGGAEDFRSDMFSLGATLFHALVGSPPFRGLVNPHDVVEQLRRKPVRIQESLAGISYPTARIIDQMLSRNPENRHQNYDKLIREIESVLQQMKPLDPEPVRAPVLNVVQLEEQPVRSKGKLIALSVVLGAAVVGGIGVVALKTSKPAPPPVVAVQKTGPVGLEQEIAALVQQKSDAAALLRAAAADGGHSPTDRVWAQLFEGVAHQMAGNTLDAKTAFSKTAEATSRMRDPKLATFLHDLSQQLGRLDPIVPNAPDFEYGNYEALGMLFYGLHDWKLGQTASSAPLIRRYNSIEFDEANSWLNDFKQLAKAVGENAVAFEAAAKKFTSSTNMEERAALAEALHAFGPAFASRTDALVAPFASELKKAGELKSRISRPGFYRITNKLSGKVLDLDMLDKDPAQDVRQWTYTGSRNQLWEALPKGNGVYRFRSLVSGKYLDVARGSMDDRGNVATWEENNRTAQEWRLIPDNDWVKIQSLHSNKLVALLETEKRDGIDVIQFSDNGTEDHLWRLDRVAGKVGEWVTCDVGETTDPSEVSVTGDSMTITTHGSDVWNNADSFTFVSQQVTGDFDLVARIVEMTDPAEFAKAGLMIRKTFSEADPNTFVCITPRHKVFHQRRFDPTGGSTQIGPIDVNVPCWLKLTRRGSAITSFYSKDGNQWTEVQTDQVAGYDSVMEVGVAASASNPRNTHTVKVDRVTITPRR